jgi:hypothetical protein
LAEWEMEHEEEFMVDGQGALRLIQEAVEMREAEAAAKKVGYAVRFRKRLLNTKASSLPLIAWQGGDTWATRSSNARDRSSGLQDSRSSVTGSSAQERRADTHA